jgi:hypothetical protein
VCVLYVRAYVYMCVYICVCVCVVFNLHAYYVDLDHCPGLHLYVNPQASITEYPLLWESGTSRASCFFCCWVCAYTSLRSISNKDMQLASLSALLEKSTSQMFQLRLISAPQCTAQAQVLVDWSA